MEPPADTPESRGSGRKAFCGGCGTSECAGCLAEFEAPRYCGECGRRLRVRVRPRGWVGSCMKCDVEVGSQGH
ncbi:MAG: hypothetical protein F4Y27_05910 [Acidimicrobiaceae bacterium]|nr:hypothetical protein [Acidimicrobiaceae bacterium]MXW75084.1 hypothetical protein [Acidimicrobiaceae bacterium]MYA74191.1 hypothetical protein [Acidimicrobiaceae bacterium]MYC42485.1 hypothetical protein [Acidimicrobiaceae bacterium]MYD07607.1 hypothetical protein [Acidimicrobiaceae bacterium]